MANNQQLLLGEGAGGAPAVYIEDVFSTYLYTGNGSTQTITNNIDLSTKGGLVWIKSRTNTAGTGRHSLWDTVRGRDKTLVINTSAQDTGIDAGQGVTSFNPDGFSLGTPYYETNINGDSVVSWTFRKQPKFFDVVTYTGNGVAGRTVAHNLGSVPGCIIVKRLDAANDWDVYHRSIVGVPTAASSAIFLNFTFAAQGYAAWNSTDPTSTEFSVFSSADVNAFGGTYVAYLFAHDAGGFGLAGTDNVISCGSFTTDGSGYATVNLGYEPQWILYKRSSAGGVGWAIVDSMRGLTTYYGTDNQLFANTSAAEVNNSEIGPTATGFTTQPPTGQALFASSTYIYIAIRRGPMKVPTVGTSVFSPVARTGTGTNPTVVTTNTNPDLLMSFPRTASPAAYGMLFWDKLRGVTQMLKSSSTAAETATSSLYTLQGWQNTGYQAGADFIDGYLNYSGSTYVNYPITRAPGFFDVVCYTGTGSATTQTHNLGISPQLVIVKARSDAGTNWLVFPSTTSFGNALYLNTTTAFIGSGPVSALSSTTVTFNYYGNPSYSASTSATTYVAYLFATCAGVSKVGTYTGNGSSQTIACGFAAGSRFVMIKRTDSTGDWYVWDSARGIIAGNDPHLSLNTTADEVTTDDSVDTDNSGFIVNQVAATNVNVTSATYIFLAIA